MGMQRIVAARDQGAIMGHARQRAGRHQGRIEAQMDMAAGLDKRHPRCRARRFQKGLRGADLGGERRLLYGSQLPPPCSMTARSKDKTGAEADQDDLGVSFHDGAGGGIAEDAGSIGRPLGNTRSAGHVFFPTEFTHTSSARPGRQSGLSQISG